MITRIRKIGNSSGIIIPQVFLKELGLPAVVDITLIEDGMIIKPVAERVTRGKPRNEDEARGLMSLASAKIRKNIETGKVRWTGRREMVRKIEL